MLKELILKNVQRHKLLNVNLSSGFNAIIGANQQGKSSIIRAIRWVIEGTPRGDWICRRDEFDENKIHTAVVKFVFDDGRVLKRVKGKGKNYYAIDDKEFHDIDNNVPREVVDLLALNRVFVNEFKLYPYIEMDKDAPFLIYEPNTLKASAINVLTGVNVVEKSIREFNSDKLDISKKIKLNEQKRVEYSEKVLKYNEILDNINLSEIDSLIVKIQSHRVKIEKLQKFEDVVSEFDTYETEYTAIRKVYEDLIELEKLIPTVSSIQGQLSLLKQFKDRQDYIDKFKQPQEVDFDGVFKMFDKISNCEFRIQGLKNLKARYISVKTNLDACQTASNTAKEALDSVVCPTCGNFVLKEAQNG